MIDIRTILGCFMAPTTVRTIFDLGPTTLPFFTPIKGLVTAQANFTV